MARFQLNNIPRRTRATTVVLLLMAVPGVAGVGHATASSVTYSEEAFAGAVAVRAPPGETNVITATYDAETTSFSISDEAGIAALFDFTPCKRVDQNSVVCDEQEFSGAGFFIRGRDRNDRVTVNGERGSSVWVEEGADTVIGSFGADAIRAGEGPDVVRGRDGVDVIDGEQGSDRMFGGAGGDELIAGPGGDIVRGEAGDDRLDTLFFEEDDEREDLFDCGDGDDSVSLGNGDSAVACETVRQAPACPRQFRERCQVRVTVQSTVDGEKVILGRGSRERASSKIRINVRLRDSAQQLLRERGVLRARIVTRIRVGGRPVPQPAILVTLRP